MKIVALCAVLFFCLSMGPPTGGAPAHPFAVTLLIDGHGTYQIQFGPITNVHVRLIEPFGEPYAEVVLQDDQGHTAYFTMDSNELHLRAQ